MITDIVAELLDSEFFTQITKANFTGDVGDDYVVDKIVVYTMDMDVTVASLYFDRNCICAYDDRGQFDIDYMQVDRIVDILWGRLYG